MKLLIAEDEKSLNDVITKKLDHEGFSTESCYNGADALDRLLYADYDLAVLDIMMPEMSGTEVVTKLRREGKTDSGYFSYCKGHLKRQDHRSESRSQRLYCKTVFI
ncbi:response regulator [Ruminococcus sp. HUN007]|uniref:response regulator n=1 Tax=Ruminococcus sp. HUN007 TaxID=1514668 RepID=UPI000AA03AB5|nr:response regulator [Ruminococcus sp. HUN007]